MNGAPPTSSTLAIAMLGVGNMAGAVLDGLLRDPANPIGDVRATTRTAESAARLARDPRVRAVATEAHPDANREAVRGARVVVIGVKPGMVAALLDEIGDDLEPDAVVISVAAGVPIAAIERRLPAGARVVRAMPNTPASVGFGVTGIAPGTHADDEAMRVARAIFTASGEVVDVHEHELRVVTGVSGSGPAYLYLFVEQLMRAAEELGLDADRARALAVGTVRGASEMLARHPDTAPAELRRRVTSPNGTTERAITEFERGGLGDLVGRAVRAAVDRADELADENA